jgi:hypothetical protein
VGNAFDIKGERIQMPFLQYLQNFTWESSKYT